MTANTSSTGGAGASSSAALRSCAYIKENDIKLLGLVCIASRKLHTGVVNGLRCRFCIVFGREERVGAKRKKPPAVGQSWVAPFRYDNIESHMKKQQHPSKWAEHEAVKKSWKSFTEHISRVEQSGLFFTKKDNDSKSKKCSSVMDHF